MHLLIRGLPRSGKTTLIKEVIPQIENKRGFYTEDVQGKEGSRVGFKAVTLDNKEVIFAHRDFKTPRKVSSFYVDTEVFDSLATKELEEAIKSDCEFIIIDEIGKMELLSSRFKDVCSMAFEFKSVLGTIPAKAPDYIKLLMQRADVCILDLYENNFPQVKDNLAMALKSLRLSQIRELEKRTQALGLEERLLIENASSNLFSIIGSLNLGKKVFVIAGSGNNGADVLSCARKLLSRGYSINVAVIKSKELSRECVFQLTLLEQLGIDIYFLNDFACLDKLDNLFKNNDFILEGILGIGIKGEVDKFLQEVIKRLNKSKKIIVSCDIPSGLSPDTGQILGEAVKADFTVTFIAPKRGFFLGQGPKICGKIYIVDIGISRDILKKVASNR